MKYIIILFFVVQFGNSQEIQKVNIHPKSSSFKIKNEKVMISYYLFHDTHYIKYHDKYLAKESSRWFDAVLFNRGQKLVTLTKDPLGDVIDEHDAKVLLTINVLSQDMIQYNYLLTVSDVVVEIIFSRSDKELWRGTFNLNLKNKSADQVTATILKTIMLYLKDNKILH